MTARWKMQTVALFFAASFWGLSHLQAETASTNATAALPAAQPELPAAELEVLANREQGKITLAVAVKHARGLTANRGGFVRALLAQDEKLIGKEREEKIGEVERIIADTEAKLKLSDSELSQLAPGKTPTEIRAGLTAKVGAEKARLNAEQKKLLCLQMELDGLKKKFKADL